MREADIPKEHTVFRFSVPLIDNAELLPNIREDAIENGQPATLRPLEFEIHGSRFRTRAADRTNKKFKMHPDPDL